MFLLETVEIYAAFLGVRSVWLLPLERRVKENVMSANSLIPSESTWKQFKSIGQSWKRSQVGKVAVASLNGRSAIRSMPCSTRRFAT